MPRYLMVARDAGNWESLAGKVSAEEIQAIIGRYEAWSRKVAEQGKLQGGEKLKDGEGRVIASKNGKVQVTDGPHVASKEVIGGFWLLNAGSYEEAVKLASDSPHLEFGGLEIREIQEMAH